MEIIGIILAIFGGVALFLFGLKSLSSGLRKLAGDKLRNLLEKATVNPVKGVATGAFITAIIQSSSITMVTLIGLVNAGLLNLNQAIGVMLGAEIGTTVTAQIVAFKIGRYFLPLIALGFFMFFSAKERTRYHYLGQTIFGFGLLFLGMTIMSDGVSPLKNDPAFSNLILSFATYPVFGALAGMLFTAIIQSSSATIAFVIAMAVSGIITLPAAIPIILGANIGTCVTALIASIGSTLSSRRLAVAHLIFNTIGVILFLLILKPFINLVLLTSQDLPRQIANSHFLFNSSLVLLALPLVRHLAQFASKIIKGKEPKVRRGARFINDKILKSPSIAVSQIQKEVVRTAKITNKMVTRSISSLLNQNKDLMRLVVLQEEVVDELRDLIEYYCEQVSEDELTLTDHQRLAICKHVIGDIERIGDHAHNIVELAEQGISEKAKFTSLAKRELNYFTKKTSECLGFAIKALEKNDINFTKKALKIENELDDLEKKYQKSNLRRLKKKRCHPALGIIYVEVLRNLERVSDHSRNIALSIRSGF